MVESGTQFMKHPVLTCLKNSIIVCNRKCCFKGLFDPTPPPPSSLNIPSQNSSAQVGVRVNSVLTRNDCIECYIALFEEIIL